MKLPLKSAITFLILASTSLLEAQRIQTLYLFRGGNDGAYPFGALTLGNDGKFYGTSSGGGSAGDGTVFKVTTNGSLTTLVDFNYGAYPTGGLTLGIDGSFYGTTEAGGSANYGTVFKVTTNGSLTTLVDFNYGASPSGGLTLGNDGNFYGTTVMGGSTNYGTVFKVTTNGTLTTLVVFNFTNGASPQAGLTLGNDGNFYGTTYGGGNGYGTVFQVTTNGTLTTLVSINSDIGAGPSAALTLGNDGNFYGTTSGGGHYGTVFKVTTNGSLTTLYVFRGGNDGAYPSGGLTLGNDGNFYGTTIDGGSSGYGAAFKVMTNGTLTPLVSFFTTNGAYPVAALTLGSDGNFYGTTSEAGSDYGTVFRLLLPPVITVQPQSETNNAGAMVTFLVSATSLTPMVYQWQKNGTNLVNGDNISGATISTLTITNISDSDAATYTVVLTDSDGSTTSSNAALTVIDPPVITAQPKNLLVLSGATAALSVSLTGAAPFYRYQWRFNGTNMLNATNALYSISSVATNNAGNYAVVITNAAASATSSNAALTVVLSPRSQTNYASTIATFTATAFSPELLNYQWQKNGTNLVEGGRLSGTTNSTLSITNISDADAANYSAVVSDATGSVTTTNATLTVNDSLFVAAQPQSQTVLAGSTVTFNVTVYGAPPFAFQWYLNGTPLGPPAEGTNVPSCILTNVGVSQAGNYSVEIVNGYGSVTSANATLTVVTLPPTVTTQPASRTNNAATTATFSVIASGLSPLSYQWQKYGTNLVNGGRIFGATTSTLSITGVSDGDASSYSVTVTNLLGSTTSSNATLTVTDPPVITTQPLSRRVLLGGSVSFNVSLNGTAPFRYQWRFNGSGILNATNATYAIQAVGAPNIGSYSVIVTNLAGSVTSSGALLTVIVPPTLALQLWAGYPLLDLSGMLSSNFVVQYSTNLAGGNWMNLLSLSNLPASPYLFLDPVGNGEPARFYRAFMQ
jgi:uncharacterized repeat protein (TIGR03803 family)